MKINLLFLIFTINVFIGCSTDNSHSTNCKAVFQDIVYGAESGKNDVTIGYIYHVSNFEDSEECWKALEEIGQKRLENHNAGAGWVKFLKPCGYKPESIYPKNHKIPKQFQEFVIGYFFKYANGKTNLMKDPIIKAK